MRHLSPSRSLLRRTVHAFFGMGLLNNALPYVLIACGQHHIASGLASILNATTPLFTVLVAHLLTSGEKLTPLKAEHPGEDVQLDHDMTSTQSGRWRPGEAVS